MNMKDQNKLKQLKRQRRHARVRIKIFGTSEKPRLSVYRSLSHIYSQIIDDQTSKTLVAASDLDLKEAGAKVNKAAAVGALLAKKAKVKGITTVIFDRGAYKYHGRVKFLADAAREGGLKF